MTNRLYAWRRHWTILGGALAFVIYLWNANEWVPSWFIKPDEQKIHWAAPLEPLPAANQFSVDGVEARPDTRLQKLSLYGWILPPEEWRGTGAGATHCEIVFEGKKSTYRLTPLQIERQDVRDIFRVENTTAVTGYRARFSPVAMKKGSYRLGLVVCSETNDLAVAWSSYVFVQDRHGFRPQ